MVIICLFRRAVLLQFVGTLFQKGYSNHLRSLCLMVRDSTVVCLMFVYARTIVSAGFSLEMIIFPFLCWYILGVSYLLILLWAHQRCVMT